MFRHRGLAKAFEACWLRTIVLLEINMRTGGLDRGLCGFGRNYISDICEQLIRRKTLILGQLNEKQGIWYVAYIDEDNFK